jgi:hypothetical protein
MGDVIRMPVERSDVTARATANASVDAGSLGILARWDVDDWGRDAIMARLAARLTHLRWTTTIGGHDRLPKHGGAIVVINSRRFALTPWFVAISLSDEVGRPVRFVGRPDAAPFGAFARRLGGLLNRPDEVAGALRDGQLLVVGASGTLDPRAVGEIDHRLIGPAVELNVPVFPAAVAVSQTSRSARIEIASAVKPSPKRRGPLAELELTTRVGNRIARLLKEFGGARTGTPLDWLPFSGMGGD